MEMFLKLGCCHNLDVPEASPQRCDMASPKSNEASSHADTQAATDSQIAASTGGRSHERPTKSPASPLSSVSKHAPPNAAPSVL